MPPWLRKALHTSKHDQHTPRTPTHQAGRTKPGEAKVKVNWAVLLPSAAALLGVATWAIITPKAAANVLGVAVEWISRWFGAYYVLLATLILGFVIYLGFSRHGQTRLGPANSRPEYSTFAWASMLFAAGIGTDIMFFAVAEPVSHYYAPPVGEGQTIEAARQSVIWTLFHYGITGWGMYALMGISLAYFAYRHRRPLAVRSSLYPVLGQKVYGWIGHLVDASAILGTIFGIATTLGIGVIQLNVGLTILFDIPIGLAAQIALVIVAVAVATASAVSGVDRGIRFLSQLNVLLAIGLATWILITGNTPFLLNAIVTNVGDFLSRFPSMTMETFAYTDAAEWMSTWTLFFWAWWVAWACFIGMFLARISRGRTLKEFVLGTMIIPFLYVLMWISIFGNSAIELILSGDTAFGQSALTSPEHGFYTLIQQYPAAIVLVAVATIVGLLFYVTSADSGALVMANLSCHLPDVRDDAPPWTRILWAAITGFLTIAVLIVGGIPALQNATIITGLPFSFVMVFVMVGLGKTLNADQQRLRSQAHSARNVVTGLGLPATTSSWRERLAHIFNQVTPTQASAYLDRVIQPALETVAEEIRDQGAPARVIRGGNDPIDDVAANTVIHDRITLEALDQSHRFIYRILAIDGPAAVYGGSMTKASERSTRLEVHRPEGGQDYDVMGYSSEAIITDVLNHFDRHQEYCRLNEADADATMKP